MGLFGSKKNKYGLKNDNTIEFTKEEDIEIKRSLKSLSRYQIKADIADQITAGYVAFALSLYAKGLVSNSTKTPNVEDFRKATAALVKAYSIYELPVYLFELAKITEKQGDFKHAQSMYSMFLEAHEGHEIGVVDKMFLINKDVDEFAAQAKIKISI